MNKPKSKINIFFVVLCGSFIGLINGFFGGGGGMICVPVLEKYLGLDNKKAHATTLCVILPLSIVSSFVYIHNNDINFLNLIYVTLGAIVGGILGAIFFNKLNSKIIRIIFAIIMLLAGIKMVIWLCGIYS